MDKPVFTEQQSKKFKTQKNFLISKQNDIFASRKGNGRMAEWLG